MKNSTIVAGFVIVLLLVVGGYYYTNKNMVPGQAILPRDPVATDSTELKNTSSTTIKNTPPSSVPAVVTVYAKIGQRIFQNGISITPSKVTYDSRCPRDVQCIQAGTVELGVLLQSGSDSQNVIITLGKPFIFAGKIITLSVVTPAKVSKKTIAVSDYKFLFTVK